MPVHPKNRNKVKSRVDKLKLKPLVKAKPKKKPKSKTA